MKYYVVSPNAANDGRTEEYLSYMRQQHIVFMGWDTAHGAGWRFSQIQPGDCILVARRQNWEWHSYFVGIADSISAPDSESGEEFEQRIELRQFTDFKTSTDIIPFAKGCTSFEKKNPGAIFQLHENNEQDQKIIRLLNYFTNRSANLCTLREIARWQANHRVSIPALQRGLVWAPKQVELLWDSLFRGFPIGSFAVAATYENPEQKTSNEGTEYFLLDGQQRYNAISLAYYLPDRQSRAALWLDFCPPGNKNSSRNFWIKTTTSSHPWGFGNDDECTVLGWKKYRNALTLFCPSEKDVSQIRLKNISLADTWPIEAGCPVLLSTVMICFYRALSYGAENAKMQFKSLLEQQLEKFQQNHVGFSPQKINDSVAESVFNALAQLQNYSVPVNVLKNQLSEDSEEIPHNGVSNLEHLFTRMNTMGSPISPYDLRYSAIKAYWAEIKEANDEIAAEIMPGAHLAVLAFRLALTVAAEKNNFADTPSITEIRKLGKDRNQKAHQIVLKLYENHGQLLQIIIQKIEKMLNIGSENNPSGLPPVLRTSIILNSPDVYLFLMYSAYLETQGVNFGAWNMQGIALWLHWLSTNSKKQNIDFLKKALEEQNVTELKSVLKELCQNKKIILPVSQFDIGNYKTKEWRIETLNEKDWKPLLNFCLWNRELLIFSERQYFNRTFSYDPAQQNFLQGHNKPWDWDHIVPQAWVRRQGKTMGDWKALCCEWLWTNGNLAAIPFYINRSKSDAAEWQEYCSHANELHFDARVLTLQENNLTYTEESAILFAELNWNRVLMIYNAWLNTIRNLID